MVVERESISSRGRLLAAVLGAVFGGSLISLFFASPATADDGPVPPAPLPVTSTILGSAQEPVPDLVAPVPHLVVPLAPVAAAEPVAAAIDVVLPAAPAADEVLGDVEAVVAPVVGLTGLVADAVLPDASVLAPLARVDTLTSAAGTAISASLTGAVAFPVTATTAAHPAVASALGPISPVGSTVAGPTERLSASPAQDLGVTELPSSPPTAPRSPVTPAAPASSSAPATPVAILDAHTVVAARVAFGLFDSDDELPSSPIFATDSTPD